MKKKSKKPSHSSGKERGRFSSRRKTEAVLRLLRGEDLDSVSRELGVTAATLSQWRESFLEAGQQGLKARREDAEQREVKRLQAKVGELTMDRDILETAIRLRGLDPFALRRSTP